MRRGFLFFHELEMDHFCVEESYRFRQGTPRDMVSSARQHEQGITVYENRAMMSGVNTYIEANTRLFFVLYNRDATRFHG